MKLSSIPGLYHGDDSNITPAVTTINVPVIARHSWEETKSPLAEYHWVRLEPEARLGPYSQSHKLQKQRPLPVWLTYLCSRKSHYWTLGRTLCIPGWLGRVPVIQPNVNPCVSVRIASKPLNSCLEVREFVLDKLHRGGREGMTKPVGRKA